MSLSEDYCGSPIPKNIEEFCKEFANREYLFKGEELR